MLEETFQIFDISRSIIDPENNRFDAGYYAGEVNLVRILLNNLEISGVEIKRLNSLVADIFWPGRFKRSYTTNNKGHAFLLPSEVIALLPKAKKFIANCPDNVVAEREWLLITRSGSVGRCLIVTKQLAKAILSDDLIRVVPHDEDSIYYIYAYLNTWLGQSMLIKDQYGGAIKHIEPHHVASIKIPIIHNVWDDIIKNMREVHRLREEAQNYLIQAEKQLYSELGFPEIDDEKAEYLYDQNGVVSCSFETNTNCLKLRFDASYHAPVSKYVRRILQENATLGRYELRQLGDKSVALLFDLPTYKRIYVRPSEGLPILSGAN